MPVYFVPFDQEEETGEEDVRDNDIRNCTFYAISAVLPMKCDKTGFIYSEIVSPGGVFFCPLKRKEVEEKIANAWRMSQ